MYLMVHVSIVLTVWARWAYKIYAAQIVHEHEKKIILKNTKKPPDLRGIQPPCP